MAISKEHALEAIRQFAKDADISPEEIAAAMGGDAPVPAEGLTRAEPLSTNQSTKTAPAELHNLSMTEVLAYIGAIIVVIGLSFLIGQNWDSLNTAMRLLLTLGVGAGFYATATYLMANGEYERAANAFQVIAAYAFSVGAGVLLYTMGVLDNRWAWVTAVAALTALYAVSDYKFRRIVFSFFTVFFATALFWAVVFASNALSLYWSSNMAMYASIVVGVSYLALAYAWQGTWRKALKNTLASFGVLFILSAAYVLAYGDSPTATMWTLLFPGVLTAMLYGSTRLHSSGMFLFAVLWLVIYIFTVTSRYFASSIGWPVALMFAGLALIAVGYFAVGFKKKYLGANKK